jgi:hypothetical protein
MRRDSNGQHYNQPIERGGGWLWQTLDAEQQTVNGQYRIRPNGNRQYPEGFIRNLSSVGHGSRVSPPTVHLVVCPNPQCQSLVRYGVQDLLVCQFGFGLHLELAALIDFRAPGIVAAVVPTLFVTFAVIVLIFPTAATTVTEQNNIGN